MAYGTLAVDTVQSSTAGTPVQFNDGNGTQVGTLCRAWVNFSGGTGVKNASLNVSSVTRNSTGNYTINFTNAMPDVNYVVQANGSIANGGYVCNTSIPYNTTPTTTALTVYSLYYVSGGTYYDPTYVSVAVFR